MTKERKLAIDMWLWIRERYDEWDDYFWGAGDEDGCVEAMKHRFIEEENDGKMPKWHYTCWLCTYLRTSGLDCKRCPLKSCGEPDSAYHVLDFHRYHGDSYVSEEVYRYYCTIILAALGYKGE